MKKVKTAPHIIEFKKIGESSIGFISVAENKNLPFIINRIYWTYYTPESVVRGRHAHYALEQILVAVAGKITVTTESRNGEIQVFDLDAPNKGLYLPPNYWHTMQYSHSSVQVSLASMEYDESDYIRDYYEFKK
jgi:hypothetical protein